MDEAALKAGLSLIYYGPLGVLAFLSLCANVVFWRAIQRKDAQLLEMVKKSFELASNLRSLLRVGRGDDDRSPQ